MTDQPTSPPPAYFLSLSLENVRSFGEKQTISFARPDGRPAQWTIILGDNGVGKTTVLKALAGSRPTHKPTPFDSTNYAPALFKSEYSEWMPNRHRSKQTTIDADIQYNEKLIAPINRKDLVWIEQMSITYKIDKQGNYTLGSVLLFKENEVGLQCYGYGAGRTTGNSILGEAPQVVDTCTSLYNDRADLINPEEWFLQMEYSSLKQDMQAGKALEQVKQVLLKVLPGVTDLQISSKGHQQYLEFFTPYGWVRLRDMSLGYQTLVVWLTDFASKLFIRYPDSKNPLEEPAIVLIDEIDLHLHPEWQRKLIGFLSGIFKNTQFIATAHSPLVVQAAGDAGANVVLLRREGDQTVVVKDLPDVKRWRIEQILSSELFEDTSPLSPQTEADLKHRNELLLKKRPTAKEKAELARLNALFGDQPVGTTRPERRAEDLLAQLARNLGKAGMLD